MKKTLKPETTKPQYVVTTDITYAQVDSWFGHCRRDLKLDLIYPEDGEGKTYPCIVWICGGAWQHWIRNGSRKRTVSGRIRRN